MLCYQRYQTESVPGCSGEGVYRNDYCAFRPPNYLLYVKDKWLLGFCEGSCDTDDDCQGDLVCFQRSSKNGNSTVPVPGCDGVGRKNSDYCIGSVTPGPTKSPIKRSPTGGTSEPTKSPSKSPVMITLGPTNSPTNAPTPAPATPEPTKSPSDLPLLETIVGAVGPLGICQGDCQDDDDCEV